MLRGSLASYPFDLQARLIDARTIQEVYEIGVTMLARIPGAIAVRIFQRDDSGELVVVHAWHSPLATTSDILSAHLAQVVHNRWIATHRVGHTVQEFARPFTDPQCRGWLLVPMLTGDELIGAIAVERRDGAVFPFAAEDAVAIAVTAAGMVWGIQSVFLRDRTDILTQQEAREELVAQERREIGRELHDNVVQDMSYVHLKMELAQRYMSSNPSVASEEIEAAHEILTRAINELRRTIGDLRRPTSARRGITGQLRALVSTITADNPDLQVDFRPVAGVQVVPEVERAVVGIVREALQNIRKHSQAQSVRLEVRRADEELRVYVSDDGIGMQGPGAGPGGHFGLQQMRELAEDLGGSIDIATRQGAGTTIEASLPLVLPAEPRSSRPALYSSGSFAPMEPVLHADAPVVQQTNDNVQS
jgi:signal transduction histidine kinase